MGDNMNGTSFAQIYDLFLTKITDDMYLEMTELDTYRLLEELLVSAIPWFEFPRKPLNYELEFLDDVGTYQGVLSENKEVPITIYSNGHFLNTLTEEEQNILAIYMVVEWLGQQLASIENVRQKYSGADYKFTSQANHLAKVSELKKTYTEAGFHLQRLYKRRKLDKDGNIIPTVRDIMGGTE